MKPAAVQKKTNVLWTDLKTKYGKNKAELEEQVTRQVNQLLRNATETKANNLQFFIKLCIQNRYKKMFE